MRLFCEAITATKPFPLEPNPDADADGVVEAVVEATAATPPVVDGLKASDAFGTGVLDGGFGAGALSATAAEGIAGAGGAMATTRGFTGTGPDPAVDGSVGRAGEVVTGAGPDDGGAAGTTGGKGLGTMAELSSTSPGMAVVAAGGGGVDVGGAAEIDCVGTWRVRVTSESFADATLSPRRSFTLPPGDVGALDFVGVASALISGVFDPEPANIL